jgi:arylsulfatase A-like enzyme
MIGVAVEPTPGGLSRAKPNVILIVVDTLAAGNLGFMGYDRDTSPFLDDLAARSVVFDRAYTPKATTEPSITSIFTGCHPVTHGVLENGVVIPDDVTFLTSRFRDAGYATWGVPAFQVIGAKYGMNQGFDFYANTPPRPHAASRVIERLDRMLNGNPWLGEPSFKDLNKPLFLFIHFYDPHTDYTPDLQSLNLFNDPDYKGGANGTFEQIDLFNKGLLNYTPDDLKHTRDLYDAEIRGLDSHLRQLFDLFDRTGLSDNSIIVLTADHGENLGEHGWITHNRPYESALHVPLIFHFPRDKNGNRRLGSLVENTDIMPTLMELAGLGKPAGIDGRSLAELIDSGSESFSTIRSFVYALGDEMSVGSRSNSIFDGRYRMTIGAGTPDKTALYDITVDPHETADIASENPGIIERLTEMALGMRDHPVDEASRALDSQTQGMLRSLGYLN